MVSSPFADIQLHNVAELIPQKAGGFLLQRIPEVVRQQLHPAGQQRAREAANIEIRYVAEGPVQLTLSAPGINAAAVYLGNFDSRKRYRIGREPTTIEIRPQERLERFGSGRGGGHSFASNVVRLAFGGCRQCGPIVLHEVTGPGLRPPQADELPDRQLLFYGGAITQGFAASAPHLAHPAIVARQLGADFINLGLAGCAACEPSMTDYLAARHDWDALCFVTPTNLHDEDYDRVQDRLHYFLHRLHMHHPDKYLICTTLLPYYRDLGIDRPSDCSRAGDPDRYRQMLRDVVETADSEQIILVEGQALLSDFDGLTADLLHPSDQGLIDMSRNLASRVKEVL